MKALLDKVKLFVLDMDGTFYLGDRRIDGALDFIHKVKETGRDFIFFTNNSSKNGSMYIEKLAAMDCPITKDRIMTSGDVTAAYLKSKYPGKKVYLVGTPALEAVFREEGICLTEEKPEVVVIGFDMTLTYEKLERACTYIREGAVFLATHKDINCPTETGLFRTAVPYVRPLPYRPVFCRVIWENHAGKHWTWFFREPDIIKMRLPLSETGSTRMWPQVSIMALWEFLF